MKRFIFNLVFFIGLGLLSACDNEIELAKSIKNYESEPTIKPLTIDYSQAKADYLIIKKMDYPAPDRKFRHHWIINCSSCKTPIEKKHTAILAALNMAKLSTVYDVHIWLDKGLSNTYEDRDVVLEYFPRTTTAWGDEPRFRMNITLPKAPQLSEIININ